MAIPTGRPIHPWDTPKQNPTTARAGQTAVAGTRLKLRCIRIGKRIHVPKDQGPNAYRVQTPIVYQRPTNVRSRRIPLRSHSATMLPLQVRVLGRRRSHGSWITSPWASHVLVSSKCSIFFGWVQKHTDKSYQDVSTRTQPLRSLENHLWSRRIRGQWRVELAQWWIDISVPAPFRPKSVWHFLSYEHKSSA